jgi:aconitate hydratase
MDSFKTRSTLNVMGQDFEIYDLNLLENIKLNTLPFSVKILLENLLRHEDGVAVTREQIEHLLQWNPLKASEDEIAFTPARVLLQDFTGVPAVVDLASMRDAMAKIGGDPQKINPMIPVELVIDHSVMVDYYGNPLAINQNVDLDYLRNGERYAFFNWAQKAFKNFRVVPPNTGIVHQVNIEYLARVIFASKNEHESFTLYPDTLVGTDSHTTMINGMGVLGWGVGGIEAEAVMLGQSISMVIPEVVGVKFINKLSPGVTATDLVLAVTQMLRKHGVVGKFVEFFGPGIKNLPIADRATLGNMAPEYGATCGIFPYDDETLRYMKLTGRSEAQCLLLKEYAQHQGLFHDEHTPDASYSTVLELDLSSVVPSLAGPKRPQDKINLNHAKEAFAASLEEWISLGKAVKGEEKSITLNDRSMILKNGSVVIAAITSCTNTSNPSVMIAAGLLAKAALERGLQVPAWVKTSLAPGSQVVTEYLKNTGLLDCLEKLGFYIVGYGCTTCIGNSGPLLREISEAIAEGQLTACAVLSGNRNFEGRIHPDVRNSYLASPPLVVAYALAGRMDLDLTTEPLGIDLHGQPVYLSELWPTDLAIAELVQQSLSQVLFKKTYQNVFQGDERWNDESSYIRNPPYFEDFSIATKKVRSIVQAKVLAVFGDSITTDHISPASHIPATSPAGKYLLSHGVTQDEFNSYGSRRGNHEVMIRGTFANIRLKNKIAQGKEGGFTTYWPTGELMSIYDASVAYKRDGTDLVIFAGQEYGSGSSRDWAAKGTRLLGVRAVIAESYERIHRSNLIGMGVLPLEFLPGENLTSLGLDGSETISLALDELKPKQKVKIRAIKNDREIVFTVLMRLDTPKEVQYIENDGILPYVVRQLYKH